jgi:hypothetical protein
LAAGQAQALSVVIQEGPGRMELRGITEKHSGENSAGMWVTPLFDGGPALGTLFWSRTGGAGGLPGVSADAFRLTQSGDTWGCDFPQLPCNPWRLTHALTSPFGAITGLSLFGQPGRTYFDRDDEARFNVFPDYGTPGSAQGDTLWSPDFPDATVTVTYDYQVALRGQTAVGDLWAMLTLDLTQLPGGGLLPGQTLRFAQDTDTIPTPAALPMIATALAALGALAARRRAAKP